MTTMMALRAHARGGPEQLSYEPAPVPAPGPGEALIAVHAGGITFAELTWDLTWTTRDGRRAHQAGRAGGRGQAQGCHQPDLPGQ
ncbi:MAG TPA: hypothetical protein VGI74_02640 [Streptosporangiaceae bacterium]